MSKNKAITVKGSAGANGILVSYETYVHAQDIIEVEELESIKMKGISRDINVFSVIERKRRLKKEKSVCKNKPIGKELSQIERSEKDIALLKTDIEKLKKNVGTILKKYDRLIRIRIFC